MDLRELQLMGVWRNEQEMLLDVDDLKLGNQGSRGLIGVTYDGSNRVTGFTFSDVTYTVTYPANKLVVSASTGDVTTINLDGSGRIISVE